MLPYLRCLYDGSYLLKKINVQASRTALGSPVSWTPHEFGEMVVQLNFPRSLLSCGWIWLACNVGQPLPALDLNHVSERGPCTNMKDVNEWPKHHLNGTNKTYLSQVQNLHGGRMININELGNVLNSWISPFDVPMRVINSSIQWPLSGHSRIHRVYHWCGSCYDLNGHYSYVIMDAITSQITGVSIVCSNVCSGTDQRKHQISASLACVGESTGDWWIHHYKGPVTRKMSVYWSTIDIRGVW